MKKITNKDLLKEIRDLKKQLSQQRPVIIPLSPVYPVYPTLCPLPHYPVYPAPYTNPYYTSGGTGIGINSGNSIGIISSGTSTNDKFLC